MEMIQRGREQQMKNESKKKILISCIIIVIILLIGIVAIALNHKEKDLTGDTSTEETNQDSTAPVVELKDSVIKIANISEIVIEELVEVSDDRGYEVRVVGYEKVATLEEATEEYLAGLSGKTSGASVEGLDDSEPTEEGVYRIVFAFADMYENETLAEIYVVYDIPEGEDVKDEPSTEVGDTSNKEDDKKPTGGNQGTEQKPSTETQKPSGDGNSGSNTGNSGTTQKPNTETQKPNTGGNQQSGGNTGSTETQKPSGGSGSGSTTTPKEEVDEGKAYDDAVTEAGYYVVTPIVGNGISAGQYGVLVKDVDEFNKGHKLLEEFLGEMGYVPTGLSGSLVYSGEGYIVYCTGIEEKIGDDLGL